MHGGAKTWYFPDGYLPEKKDSSTLEAHEALMVLNTGTEAADIEIDFYFEDLPPIKGIKAEVDGERVSTFRLDNPDDIGGVRLKPLQQYSLRIRSSQPVIIQFGRLDTTQSDLAYYVGVGYAE